MPAKTVSEEERDRKRAYHREWRRKNLARRLAIEKRYRENNKEKITARRSGLNGEQLEKRRAYHREYWKRWKAGHPERVKAVKQRSYRKTKNSQTEDRKIRLAEINRKSYEKIRSDPERVAKRREDLRKWMESNPDRVRDLRMRGSVRRRAIMVGDYTSADITAMYESQSGICTGCDSGLNGKFEIDHIMPLALDPTGDKLENLQLLCKRCNRAKRAMHPDEWAKVRLGLPWKSSPVVH